MTTITVFENSRKRNGVYTELLEPGSMDHVQVSRTIDSPVLILGPCEQKKKSKNSISELHAVSLDIRFEDAADFAAFKSETAHLESVIYSGFFFDPAVPHVIAVYPFSRPATVPEYKESWRALNELSGGLAGYAGKDPVEPIRFPCVPNGADMSAHFVERNSGKRLDPDITREHIPPELLEQLKYQATVSELWRCVIAGDPYALEGSEQAATDWLTWNLWTASQDLSYAQVRIIFEPSVESMPGMMLMTVGAAYENAPNYSPEPEGESPATEPEEWSEPGFNGNTPILHCGKNVYIYDEASADYLSVAHSESQLAIDARLGALIKTRTNTKGGGFRLRPVNEVIAEYGILADCVELSACATKTTYISESRTIRESVCQLRRDLEPEFDTRVDGWLRALGGEQYPKLVDWLACAPDLSRLLCGIYFKGPANGAKTNFAHWLARLWHRGAPLDIRTYIKGWNDYLTKCPIVLCDEAIPSSGNRGQSDITEEIRSMITSKSRNLNRKFRDSVSMEGALRLILAANNDTLLATAQIKTEEDLEAISQRILYVEFGDAPVRYLKDLGRENWWDDDALARHALWLQANHEVAPPNNRLWVSGEETKLHRILLAKSFWNSQVCEVLCALMRSPQNADVRAGPDCTTLAVSTTAVRQRWDAVHQRGKNPTTEILVRAMTALSTGRDGKWWTMNLDIIKEWSSYAGIEY